MSRSPLHFVSRFLLCCSLCIVTGTAAVGSEGPAVVTPHMRAQLVSAFSAVSPGQTFTVAMRQQIRSGWHTYWQNPGDSGEPTELNWQLPPGWQASPVLWPAPHRIAVGPLVNFGYSDEVLLLSEITVSADTTIGDVVTLEADAYWLVCEEICIPEEGRLALTLTVADTAQTSQWHSPLTAASAALPQPLPWPVTASLSAQTLQLQWPVPEGATVTDATYFPLHKAVIHHASQQVLERNGHRLTLSIPRDFAAAPDTLSGLLVITENVAGETLSRAFRIAPTIDTAANAIQWWLALAMAFAGGVILNLMPCVFPILSIKALSLMQLATGDPKHQRRLATEHGFAFGAGVVLGFILLAALLLVLRHAGVAAGWGFHLQNSAVVLALAWLFFAIGLNLSGAFEIGMRWTGVGQSLTEGGGYRHSLFTGLLATVVATPCTAPFMGAALGYALVQPAAISFAVFVFLGLGMATPFVLLCLFPAWLRRLPAPGQWMLQVKELLAFPMYLSCVWLLWVLVQQQGSHGLLLGGGGAVAIAFFIWLGNLQTHWLRRSGRAVAVAILAVLLLALADTAPGSAPPVADNNWQSYSQHNLQQARRQGPVFVNFTADWCITCKANEQIALNTPRVTALFEEKGVTRLKGDWTRRDATITRTLEQFGRSGVPLYLWYANPAVAQPEILPQLLTENMLVERLQKLPPPPTVH